MWGTGKRFLVAGGGGFIGGHMVARLRDLGAARVRAVDIKDVAQWYQVFPDVENVVADLRSPADCEMAVSDVDVVINLAADMGGMGFISTHRVDCMRSVLINTHLLDAAAKLPVDRFFYASSACVYNEALQTDSINDGLREEDAYPAMPENGYGWEKLFSERLCQHYLEEMGLAVRVARFHNVYGPNGTWDGGREKAPAAISRKIAQAVLTSGDEIEIWGDGQQGRSFMFVDDCVEGVLRLLDSEWSDPINLGSSRLVTINELVDIVEAIAGVQLKRRYLLDAPQGVRGRNSNNDLIKRELGWEPSTSLEVGLEQTYRWVYDQIRNGVADVSRDR
jgi:nucleoside-diphosphate-sugar epimerase